MKNKFLIPFLFFLLGLIFITGYMLLKNNANLNPQTSTTQLQTSQTPTNSPTVTNDDVLKAGGSSFMDPKGVFNILYPSDYKMDSQNNGQYTRLYKTGPTQKGQTEMYDGVIVVLESVSLGDKSLSTWVEDKIKSETTDGSSEIVNPKTSITINNYSGFKYSTRGLGVADNIIIQKDSNSKYAIAITYLVSDPQNLGFQSEVNSIISSLKFQK